MKKIIIGIFTIAVLAAAQKSEAQAVLDSEIFTDMGDGTAIEFKIRITDGQSNGTHLQEGKAMSYDNILRGLPFCQIHFNAKTVRVSKYTIPNDDNHHEDNGFFTLQNGSWDYGAPPVDFVRVGCFVISKTGVIRSATIGEVRRALGKSIIFTPVAARVN